MREALTAAPGIDRELEARIIPWLAWARDRTDYQDRVRGKLWAEKSQGGFLRALEGLVPDYKSRRILEVGCGMGGLSTALRLAGCDVTGLDFNADYCAIARLRARRHGLDLHVVRTEAESLPFPDASFGLVISFETLEHVRDPRRALREIHRVLAPGGAAWLWLVNRWSLLDPHYHLYGVNWLPRSWGDALIGLLGRGKDHLPNEDAQSLSEMHYFSWRESWKLLAEAGFSQVQDARRLKLEDARQERPGWKWRALAAARRLRLDAPFYAAWNWLVQSDFNFLARP